MNAEGILPLRASAGPAPALRQEFPGSWWERLHLAFKRQVPTEQAARLAGKNCMTFLRSAMCNFNVIPSPSGLSRIVLMRHSMENLG